MGKKTNTSDKPVDKHAAFLRVVTPRVNKALKAIELIGNQAGAAYAPTKAEVAEMFVVLRRAVDNAQKCYTSGAAQVSGFSFAGK